MEVIDIFGVIGWGEVFVFFLFWYIEEIIGICLYMLKDFFIFNVVGCEFNYFFDVLDSLVCYKGNWMVKVGFEFVVWDIYVKKKGIFFVEVLGGIRDKVFVGVVVGLVFFNDMLKEIESY